MKLYDLDLHSSRVPLNEKPYYVLSWLQASVQKPRRVSRCRVIPPAFVAPAGVC